MILRTHIRDATFLNPLPTKSVQFRMGKLKIGEHLVALARSSFYLSFFLKETREGMVRVLGDEQIQLSLCRRLQGGSCSFVGMANRLSTQQLLGVTTSILISKPKLLMQVKGVYRIMWLYVSIRHRYYRLRNRDRKPH